MLLGREAMVGRFIVNPSLENVLGNKSDKQLLDYYGHLMYEKSGLTIGLLATNKELYSNKRIMEAGRQRGHDMKFYNMQQCYIGLDNGKPEVRYRGGNIVSVDAIIPRIRPSMTFYGCALLRQFESINTYCLNSADSISSI